MRLPDDVDKAVYHSEESEKSPFGDGNRPSDATGPSLPTADNGRQVSYSGDKMLPINADLDPE